MQGIVNGLISGSGIALLALAFAIVYIPTRTFHLALGGVYTLAPFIAWACILNGWPKTIAITCALIASIATSVICELGNHWRLENKGSGFATQMIASLGTYIVIVQSIVLVWGNESRVLRAGLDPVLSIANLVITQAQILTASVSIASMIAFFLVLHFSNIGLSLKAIAGNAKEFALRGHNVRVLRVIVFSISGALAGISGLLISNDIGFEPYGGLVALLPAIVATIIGGRFSFAGAVLGGIFLGVVRSATVYFLSSQWQDAVTFLLLAACLFVLPNGLLSRAGRVEADA
jgi:branched-chain amino acid transport system permease protein